MNISTGGGTLVHEIVHPFIQSNFPNCPSWFNEGLGSLYEQCRERNGKIVLIPANEMLTDMVFEPDEVHVYGRVVTVMRKL